ncbi:MAG: YveK family protein [Oscillospiraceae bacterium]
MTRNQTGTEETEIDLLELAKALMRRAWFIILVTVLVAAAAFGYTYCFVTPMYTATALMYVNNTSFSVGSTSFSISASELTAAQSLVDTYGVILKSRMTLEDIIQKDNLDYTYEELYSMIQTKAVNSTEIFEVSVTSSKPAEAEYIANTIAEVLPDKIAAIVEGSDVRIVDYAVIPSSRTSPSYTKNTAIGALLGLVIAAAVVILQYMLDENIRSEDYLAQTYPNIPLLSVVPDMSNRSREHGSSSARPQTSGARRTAPPGKTSAPAKDVKKSRQEPGKADRGAEKNG